MHTSVHNSYHLRDRQQLPRGSMACSLQLAVLMSAAVALAFGVRAGAAELCSEYYDQTCPDVHRVVRRVLKKAHEADVRIYASLTRLHFHDCFVQSGGPRWRVPLGRRDGTTANITAAGNLPSPFDNLTTLQQKFGAVGLDDTDLVALSGAHTFGRVQCQFVTARLYNFSGTNRPDPTLDRGYRAFLRLRCPRGGNASALNDLDPTTPDTFDSNYYANIQARRGTLQSDQELLSTPGAPTAPIVGRFAGSQKEFFRSFARSMISMGNIRVLTGSQGEIRKNCRVVNGG